MQLSLALIFAFTATLVSSQSVSSLVAQLPSCAISCLATASSTVGCGISDYACQCGPKKAALTSAATPCVIKACSSTDALKVNGLTSDICKASSGTQTSMSNPGSYVSNIHPATSSKATTYTTIATASITTYPASAPTTTAGSAPSATTSTPATVSGNAGTKLQGGVLAAGAVMLAALAL